MTYDPATDLYARLAVAHDAPVAVIRNAYRILIVRVHPDIHGAAGHTATLLLNEAWEILGDEGKRAAYDAAWKQHHERAQRPAASNSPQSPRPKPHSRARRASQGQRPHQSNAKAKSHARRPANVDWSNWEEHVHPHPTKSGYYQIDEELIAKAVETLFTLVEGWLKRRRDPSSAPG
jgi:curved DNA-binding protein CbpA